MARKNLGDAAAGVGGIRPIEADEAAQAAAPAAQPAGTVLAKKMSIYVDPDRHKAAVAVLEASDGRSFSRLVHDLLGEFLAAQRGR